MSDSTIFALGMLDPMEGQPYVNIGAEAVDSAQSRNVSLRAAREGMVFLTWA